MLVAGTGDGAYRVTGIVDSTEADVRKVLDAPRVERVRTFDAVDGIFAATGAGLQYSPDGRDWTDLGVPVETVWAAAVAPTGERIYAGTRPTHVFSAPLPDDGIASGEELDWRELDGFRNLPSRDDWGVPRHDNVAQVRELRIHPDSPERVVAGVEPGGIHVSTDGGETWEERNDGVHDDVHGIHLDEGGEIVAATGIGLHRTTDAGRSWARLDGEVEQRYFRAAYRHDGALYTAATCVPPSDRWETPDADPAVFEWRDGGLLEAIEFPRPDEVVVGWRSVDDALVCSTHRGTILRRQGGNWTPIAKVPSPETIPGCYCNLTWIDQ